MIIALVSENFNKKFPVIINTKLAVVTYILRKHIFPVQIKRYISIKHISKTHYVIDLDECEKKIVESLDILLKFNNIEIESYKDYTKHYKLLTAFNGSVFRWPLSYSKYICTGLFRLLASMNQKEVHRALNHGNINKSVLGHYMHLMYAVRVLRKKNDYLIKYIEEYLGEDTLAYFKSVCSKHRIKYHPGEYIRCKPELDILFKILDDHSTSEFTRDEIVSLSNTLEIGRCFKDVNYYAIRDGLEDMFVYSIYHHKFTDDKTSKKKESVLVNIIANRGDKAKIEKIKKLAKSRYPKLCIYTNIQWIRKR